MAERVNIVLCGDGGCGKSSITLRLVRSQWTYDYDPTIEDSYSVTRTIDGRPCLLSLTDTAGQEEYRSLSSSYTQHADAFLLVYDITSAASLHEQLPYFVDLVAQECEAREDAGRVRPVVVVVGNKCDLQGERTVSAKEGLEWARARGCGFMETSARECVNVEETFALLVRRVFEAHSSHSAQMAKPRVEAPPAPPTKDSSGPEHGASFSKTLPLTPVHEKRRAEQEGAWGRFKTWWRNGTWRCW